MRRSLLIFLAVLAAGVAVFAGAYFSAQQICTRQMARSADDLDWLRRDFKLGDSDMARIRQLHEGYMPRCAEMCKLIAAKKDEIKNALANQTNVSAAAEKKLIELGGLRAECQTQMLRHFVEVSHAMPPEQGRRYLAEMQRLTLGFHEEVEHAMSSKADPVHGHDH